MKVENKFFDKITIIFSIICITVITAVGCIFLTMENIDKSTIMKSNQSSSIENQIDKIYISEDASSGKYDSEIYGLININAAQKEELMLLEGIGDKKADAIIAYRSGTPFKRIEDLLKVKGIGEKTFEQIKRNICVN